MRERSGDLVLATFELVSETQMLLRRVALTEPHVEQVAEVVVVPRVARSEIDRAAVGGDRCPEVAEHRLAQTHQRIDSVVRCAGVDQLAQVQRREPRRLLQAQLGELAMREQTIAIGIACFANDRLEIAHDIRAALAPSECAFNAFSQATQAAVALVGHACRPAISRSHALRKSKSEASPRVSRQKHVCDRSKGVNAA